MVKKTRPRQSSETKGGARNHVRPLLRRFEGGIKRGKSASFETRGLSIGRKTQNCTAGFTIFSKLDRNERERERERKAWKDWPRRVHCYGTGPIAGRVRRRPRTWDYYEKKRDWGHSFLYSLNVGRHKSYNGREIIRQQRKMRIILSVSADQLSIIDRIIEIIIEKIIEMYCALYH